jgi:hypothetical protein
MKMNIAKITLLSLVAAALTLNPTISRAQDASTNAPAASPKKHSTSILPFQGKVTAVDAAAETLTAGKYKLTVVSTTKILNSTNNAPATLSDITVGEMITGSYKKAADGKTLNAYSIHIGTKAVKHKKKKPADDSTTSTNSASN